MPFSRIPRILLEPIYDMVLCIEIIDKEAEPAGDKDEHAADDLTDHGDGLLEDIKNSKDCKDQTYDVKNCSHCMKVLCVD